MENLKLGIYTTILGMVIVFVGLLFLMYVMIALAKLSKGGEKKQVDRQAPVEEEPETHDMSTDKAADAAPLKGQDLGEIAAVAAVMAIMTAEGKAGVVASVMKTGPKTNTWALAGRRDIMAGRL